MDEGWLVALAWLLDLKLWAGVAIAMLVTDWRLGLALAFTAGIVDNLAARTLADAWGSLHNIPLNGLLCVFYWTITLGVKRLSSRHRLAAPAA